MDNFRSSFLNGLKPPLMSALINFLEPAELGIKPGTLGLKDERHNYDNVGQKT